MIGLLVGTGSLGHDVAGTTTGIALHNSLKVEQVILKFITSQKTLIHGRSYVFPAQLKQNGNKRAKI